MKKVLIIDGNSLAFTAKPNFEKEKDKIYSNTDGRDIYVASKFVKRLMNYKFYNYKDHKIVVAFDERIKNTFRHEFDPGYKNRPLKDKQVEMKEYVYDGVDELKKSLSKLGIPFYSDIRFEADDIIGMLVDKYSERNYEIKVVTSDADLMQLLSKNVSLLLRRGHTEELVTMNDISKYLDCKTPKQVIDIKALWGDKSDNIKHFMSDDVIFRGVKGNTIRILMKYGSLRKLYKNIDEVKQPFRDIFIRNKDKIDHNIKLVTIVRKWSLDVDFDYFLKYNETKEGYEEVLKDLNLDSLFTKNWFKYGFAREFIHNKGYRRNYKYKKKPSQKNKIQNT